jgi:hypothetical protein
MSTSEIFRPEDVYSLGDADLSWLRIGLPGLADFDEYEVLTDQVEIGFVDAKIESGKRLGDIIGTTWPMLYIISNSFVAVLNEWDLSGWRTLPVHLQGGPGVPLFLLQVTGQCGPIVRPANNIGSMIDPDSLDGSDFFVPANRGEILLSPRAGNLLSRSSLRNIEVLNAGLESTPP